MQKRKDDDMLETIDIEDLPRAQKRFAKQFEKVSLSSLYPSVIFIVPGGKIPLNTIPPSVFSATSMKKSRIGPVLVGGGGRHITELYVTS